MGYKLKKVEVKLEANEEKELCLVLKQEKRAAIHGVVKFPGGNKPVKNALVKLFKKKSCDPCDLCPVTFTYTDECGQFLFGVDSCVDYVIKVFYYKSECIETEKCEDNDDCDC